MNVLLVENDLSTVQTIEHALFSPMIRLQSVHSFSEARNKIITQGDTWHCWILNPEAGKEGNSLLLMKEFSHFPFIIILSGLGNMRFSFKITQLGVLDVYDKKPVLPLNEFVDSVFRTTVLGYILAGKRSDYMQVFLALKNNVFTTAPQWADFTCISLRYLEQLCKMHCGLSPRYVLPLYYHLVSSIYFSSESLEISYLFKMRYSLSERTYFNHCHRFVNQNLNIKNPLIATFVRNNQKRAGELVDTFCSE